MPLRDDLLEPIEGDNPSGPSLQYDKVFDQLKEARIEDDESIPSGQWGRAPKKADRVLVIKVAGETLAKRTKDVRLLTWYLESLLRQEGFPVLVPGLELIQQLQEVFWETLHPEPDAEDSNPLDLRIGAMEGASNLLALSIKAIPLTRTGMNWGQYQDARAVGFESDGMSEDKRAAREDAINRGKATGEELRKAIDGTPKAFYAETEASLVRGLELLEELDRFNEEKYGDDYPSLGKLKSSLEDVKKIVSGILTEKRIIDPDPIPKSDEPEVILEQDGAEQENSSDGVDGSALAHSGVRRSAPAGAPSDRESSYALVASCAEFLLTQDRSSPVAYLLCTALRLGETRNANLEEFAFAVAPSTETRQTMRRLATQEKWDELMKLCIQTLPEPCGRVWLDLQRYVWRAAEGLGYSNLAATVVSTVRSLLVDLPAVRTVTLDDDTSGANPETQQWIDQQVLLQ